MELHPDNVSFVTERVAAFTSLLQGAQKLAQQSRNSETTTIADFLTQRALLRVPIRGARIGYYPTGPTAVSPQDAVFLVLVKSTDCWLVEADNPAQQFTQPGRFATIHGSYYTSTRSIYLSADWRVSEFWQSLIVLHEATHAYDNMVTLKPKSPMWRGELHARRLDYRVLVGLKGAVLTALLSSELVLREIDEALRAGMHLKFFKPTTTQISERQLDQIFGPAQSLDEAHYRRGIVGRCFVQYYLEQANRAVRLLRLAVT